MTSEPSPSRRERWDERHAAHDPIESAEPDPTLVEICAALPAGRALDLGAGDGRNAIWLAGRGWRVTAVDFSPVALERARTRAIAAGAIAAGADVDWQLHDLLEWRPDPGAFDLVALVFIHLPETERREVYASAAAAVAPGGTLLVIGHDRSNIADGVGGPQDPEVLFTADEIAADLPAGFRVSRAEAVRRGTGADLLPIDAVVVARRADGPTAGRTG